MIKIHNLENSRSHRILWLCEEIGIAYEIVDHKRNPKTQLASKAVKSLHPTGKFPIIQDEDLVLAESGAIIEYLVDRYGNGKLTPDKGSHDYLLNLYWLHAAEGSIMPLIITNLLFHRTTQKPVPALLRPITKIVADNVGKAYINPSLSGHFDNISQHLEKYPWFGGKDFSSSDIAMGFPILAASKRIKFFSNYPKISEYLSKIQNRPAYQRAIKKGGELALI